MTIPTPRCLRCHRPQRLCFCDAITHVDNRTPVLILQHRRERFHPFNTARIVNESLRQCTLMVAHNDELAQQFSVAELQPSAGLLYPGAEARLLSELPPEDRPGQLVILDGTWHQAKTLFRDIPRLQSLPQYRLAPSSPGRYRIRREPNEHALSTLEATVAALAAIEPETEGLNRLIETFDRMINDQIGRHVVPVEAAVPVTNWRRNERRRRGSANVPRVLAGNLNDIVVAYGEREPGRPVPIYWTAVRLGCGERFQCAIESDVFEDASLMRHLCLDPKEIDVAVSVAEFRRSWRAFLRPSDHLAIQHFGTAGLLKTVDAEFSPIVILKSVNVPPVSAPVFPYGVSRASQRLQTAVDYVYQLRSMSV